MSTYESKLTAMFAEIEPEFRAKQSERYKTLATSQLEIWLKYLDGPKPDDTKRRLWSVRLPDFVDVHGGSYNPQWEAMQAMRKRGDFRCAYGRAEKAAKDSVDYAKLHFVTKQNKKLTNATKNHKGSPSLGGRLGFDSAGVIVGALTAVYENGDEFTVMMSVIVNYRYNSRTGGGGFYQFPARFGRVKMGGEVVKARLSEGWMERNFK